VSKPFTPGSTRHDFPGRRWLIVVLRSLHLVAVIALGALLLGAPADPAWPFGAVVSTVLATGLVMFVLDLIADRQHLRTVAGLSVAAKLALVSWLAIDSAVWQFWAIVVISAVVSHAPASFRHRRIL
jgi:hypothetical protein